MEIPKRLVEVYKSATQAIKPIFRFWEILSQFLHNTAFKRLIINNNAALIPKQSFHLRKGAQVADRRFRLLKTNNVQILDLGLRLHGERTEWYSLKRSGAIVKWDSRIYRFKVEVIQRVFQRVEELSDRLFIICAVPVAMHSFWIVCDVDNLKTSRDVLYRQHSLAVKVRALLTTAIQLENMVFW